MEEIDNIMLEDETVPRWFKVLLEKLKEIHDSKI